MFMQDQTTFTKDETVVGAADTANVSNAILRDGMLAGTLVETANGWCRAERLKSGDMVHTFDGGLRPVIRVEHRFFDLSQDAQAPDFLVKVPGGVLNTCSDTQFLPDQKILLEDNQNTGTLGGLARVADLCGIAGVALVRPTGMLQSVRPILENEEILWANTGLMCHFGAVSDNGSPEASPFFTELSAERARIALHDQCRSTAEILQFRAA